MYTRQARESPAGGISEGELIVRCGDVGEGGEVQDELVSSELAMVTRLSRRLMRYDSGIDACCKQITNEPKPLRV
jgi:hypothetical protein